MNETLLTPKEFLTIDDVTRYLNVKRSCVYSLVEAGAIPHYRIGRLIRFKRHDIDQWMENHRQDPFQANKRARAILKATNNSNVHIDKVVNKSIAEIKVDRYTPNHGRPDQDKDLRKEVSSGTL